MLMTHPLPLKDFDKVQQDRLQLLMNNLAKDFSSEGLSKSPARFNLKKLQWFNQEYIKSLSLEEFAYRACKNKLQQTYPDKRLREGSYVYLVDTDKGLVYLENGNFPLGGGKDEGESDIDCLIREVQEESNNQLTLDPSKLIKIASYQYLEQWGEFEGKHCHLYFYPLAQVELQNINTLDEWKSKQQGENVYNTYIWCSLEDFITNNPFTPYPIWQQFCLKQQLPCFKINTSIIRQYLAWKLDQNRITVLSELGTESKCVLNWQAPSDTDLTWKKSDLETSKQALKVVADFSLSDALWSEVRQELVTVFNLKNLDTWDTLLVEVFEQGKLAEFYTTAVNLFETKIKDWLTQNNLDYGLHLWTLRLALSGSRQSPSPFEILPIIGQEEASRRINTDLI
jgi:glutamyl/glutaminyl-tRNA synthetase